MNIRRETTRWTSIAVFLLYCCIGLVSRAQTNFSFRNFTINDGLSQSCVNTILQDDVGTLWLGTQDGLNRFDGDQFQVFTSEETPGLNSQYINSSIQDRKGNLWFGTANGLTVFNPRTERFETYNPKSKNAFSVDFLAESSTGKLFVASSTHGLASWNSKLKTIELVDTKIPSKHFHYLSFLTDRLLLISTDDKGAYTFDIVSKRLTKVRHSERNIGSWLINDVELFTNGNYLLSTTTGLWLYDYKANVSYPFLKSLDKEYGIKEIADVYLKSTSEFFIGTTNKGLVSVKKVNGKYNLSFTRQDIFQKKALISDEIRRLYADHNGVIWLGTLRGLGCFDPGNQGFLGVGPSGNTTLGLPSENVWGFSEDKTGTELFVATDAGVSHLNNRTGLFTHYNLPDELSELGITGVFYIQEGELFVGTSNGLYLLKYGPFGSCLFTKIDFKLEINTQQLQSIYRIIRYSKDQFFIATKGGVVLYDYTKNESTAFVHSAKNPNKTIPPGICRVVYEGKGNLVYVATNSGGVSVIKKNSKGDFVVSPYKYNGILRSKTTDYVSCMYQDENGNMWFGTSGSGVVKITPTGSAKALTKRDGLPNNFIYGIEEDEEDNLWFSTNKGLCRLKKSNDNVTSFLEVNGLMSNEFNTGATLKSVNGTLYFGGIAGYNFFNPKNLSDKTVPLNVKFLKIKFDNKWLIPGEKGSPLSTAFSETQQIVLPYHQRSFTIHFLASDLMNPELLEYKYRLIGSDEDDVFLGNSTEIRFNSLSPGDYTLEVYARRYDGSWEANPARLTVKIESPFWWKLWFWIPVGLVLVLLIRWFIRRRIDLARRDQVKLEMKIVERTKEIRNQNIRIEAQSQIIQEEKNKVEEQKRLLQIEKDKSEKLLRNIIPESTAEELKNKGRASARAYKTVSVLFTDFVGFTKIAEGMKPTELVNKLDIYFRKFDDIIVKNNLEKIKTIGDAYMCAGGVPVRNNTNPIDAVLAALQIQEYMEKLRLDAIANGTEYWILRLGIHTGEVTAGVIGSERLAYDIWGSTVNQAQRMEMMGEPGRVTISGATFNLIEPYFECTFRGKVPSKSKGLIDMFTVERIKPELSVNGEGLYPNERFQQIVNLHLYSSINYYKAERHIMKVLEKGLSSKLHYHSIAHTKDVVRAVERYALLEGVTDEGLFLLKSAATYHDAGFVENYEKNEPIGARMAEEILPKYGYSEQHIDSIKELIYVTQIPHQPKNKLEEIICDADLDYLGRDDFHEIADRLRLELREHGKIDSDRKWDEMQVGFLKMHKYFTPTAIASRQTKKAQNLQEVIERLERNEYKD